MPKSEEEFKRRVTLQDGMYRPPNATVFMTMSTKVHSPEPSGRRVAVSIELFHSQEHKSPGNKGKENAVGQEQQNITNESPGITAPYFQRPVKQIINAVIEEQVEKKKQKTETKGKPGAPFEQLPCRASVFVPPAECCQDNEQRDKSGGNGYQLGRKV